MNAQISFNFSDMKEYIKIGKETITANIGSSFLDILSLDTNFIKKEIIEKTNFNDLTEIKKAYKKVHKLQPLLFIDKFDLIEYLNDFNNSKKILKDYNNSIEQLTSLINFQKNINNNNELLSELTKNLKYLKQRKKNYLKLTNNLPKYINNVFSIIITQIELYKSFIEVCYLDKKDNYFENFSKLTPLKKCAYYTTFQLGKNKLFSDLPSTNIVFSFELLSHGLTKELKDMINNNISHALKTIFEKNISPIYEYNCQTLEQFLQISFFTCLTQNLNIKKCENCDKYFIAYQRSDEKYCNRSSPQDKNKTCKQYANLENWKNNINSNEELKIYRRIYMAKQMQTRRNPDNLDLKNNFEIWKKEAQKLRNEYIHGIISKTEFLTWLNNNS
jgi:hypothetical protein